MARRTTKIRQPKSGRACVCGYSTCRCNSIVKADTAKGNGARPCPQHPGYMLRGTATRCSHVGC